MRRSQTFIRQRSLFIQRDEERKATVTRSTEPSVPQCRGQQGMLRANRIVVSLNSHVLTSMTRTIRGWGFEPSAKPCTPFSWQMVARYYSTATVLSISPQPKILDASGRVVTQLLVEVLSRGSQSQRIWSIYHISETGSSITSALIVPRLLDISLW